MMENAILIWMQDTQRNRQHCGPRARISVGNYRFWLTEPIKGTKIHAGVGCNVLFLKLTYRCHASRLRLAGSEIFPCVHLTRVAR